MASRGRKTTVQTSPLNTGRDHVTPTSLARSTKTGSHQSQGGPGATGTFVRCGWEREMGQRRGKTVWQASRGPAGPLPRPAREQENTGLHTHRARPADACRGTNVETDGNRAARQNITQPRNRTKTDAGPNTDAPGSERRWAQTTGEGPLSTSNVQKGNTQSDGEEPSGPFRAGGGVTE